VPYLIVHNRNQIVVVLNTRSPSVWLYDVNICVWCASEPAVEVLGFVALRLGQRDRRCWEVSLVLPAGVGWVMFLKLWTRKYAPFLVEKGGRELLCVEVLDVKSNGEAKFRLWYYKWRKTRPQQPYVDVEIKPYQLSGNRIRFRGFIYANKTKDILKEHLAEIADLLKHRGVERVLLQDDGKALEFTGAFRDSVLSKLGVKPELPQGEPPAVQYLGGLKFKVGDREVEFGNGLYAKLTFPSGEETGRFASSLKAVGVHVEVAGNVVRLDRDSFFGLLAITNAAPPSLTPLYRSEEDSFRVYASARGWPDAFLLCC